jgi:hypothetical protein
MFKNILILVLLASLSGCGLFRSGITEYSLKPIENSKGEMVCCEATVYNSKDYDKLKFKFSKNADGSMTVNLDEDGVSASSPSQVQAENNSKLLDAVTSIIPIVKDR